MSKALGRGGGSDHNTKQVKDKAEAPHTALLVKTLWDVTTQVGGRGGEQSQIPKGQGSMDQGCVERVMASSTPIDTTL